MSRIFMCQYGDCQYESAKLPVIVTIDSSTEHFKDIERKRFCSEEHAAGWLAERVAREARNAKRGTP